MSALRKIKRQRERERDEARKDHLFCHLTWEEFHLVFAIALVAMTDQHEESYPLSQYASQDKEGPAEDWIEAMIRAIRYLSWDLGYEFAGVEAHRDGRMVLNRAVEPRNNLFVLLMESGRRPSFLNAAHVAVEYAQHRIPEMNTGPLRSFAASAAHDKAEYAANIDPEQLAAEIDKQKQALRAVGALPPEVVH